MHLVLSVPTFKIFSATAKCKSVPDYIWYTLVLEFLCHHIAWGKGEFTLKIYYNIH